MVIFRRMSGALDDITSDDSERLVLETVWWVIALNDWSSRRYDEWLLWRSSARDCKVKEYFLQQDVDARSCCMFQIIVVHEHNVVMRTFDCMDLQFLYKIIYSKHISLHGCWFWYRLFCRHVHDYTNFIMHISVVTKSSVCMLTS